MSFLEKALQGYTSTAADEDEPEKEPITPEQKDEPEKEPPASDDEPEKEVTPDEKPNKEEPEEDVTPTVPSKIEVNYLDWLKENKDSIDAYFRGEGTDYSKLSKEEIVKLELKEKHPEYSEEDIEEELKDKYGIGLELMTIDEDTMTDEELKDAKAHNKEVLDRRSRGGRSLKTQATQAYTYFEDKKGKLELPKFEIDAPAVGTPEQVDEAKVVEDVLKQQNEAYEKDREERWVPTLKGIIEPFQSVQEKISFEVDGKAIELDVAFDLSDEIKDSVMNELVDYRQQSTDPTKYVDEKGVVSSEVFVKEKIKELNYKKLMSIVGASAYNKGKQDFVKEDLVNYDDGRRRGGDSEEQTGDFGSSFFKAKAAKSGK